MLQPNLDHGVNGVISLAFAEKQHRWKRTCESNTCPDLSDDLRNETDLHASMVAQVRNHAL